MIVKVDEQIYAASHAWSGTRAFPYWTLELTTSGTMLRRTDVRGRFATQPNRALILTPPQSFYALRAQESGWEIWAIFDPRDELLPYLDWAADDHGLRALPLPEGAEGRRLVEHFREVKHQAGFRTPAHDLLAEHALERLIIEAVLAASEERGAELDERIARVIEQMRAVPAASYTVTELARQANLSESRFAHLFREETGETPMACLERLRLEQAQHLLLRSDLQIQEVAREVGFEDPYYFSTRFRKFTGKPPRAWRQAPG